MKKIYIFIVLVIVVLLGSIGWLSINYLSGTKSSEQEQIEQKLTQLEKHNKELEGRVKKLDQKGSSVSSSEKLESSSEESSVQETTIESQVSREEVQESTENTDKGYGNKQTYTTAGYDITFDYPVNDVDWIGFQEENLASVQAPTPGVEPEYVMAREDAFRLYVPDEFRFETPLEAGDLRAEVEGTAPAYIIDYASDMAANFSRGYRLPNMGPAEASRLLRDNYIEYGQVFPDTGFPYYIITNGGGQPSTAFGIGSYGYDRVFETNFSGQNSENNSRDMSYLLDEYYK